MADYGLIHGDAQRIPLRDESVDVVISSPPYFALRSYQDDGEHYAGQIGSEPTPADFLAALWAVTDELWRVLKPTGSLFLNLGDKYAGSGGGNQSGVLAHRNKAHTAVHEHRNAMDAPRRYNQSADVPVKSLMGLPWRYALGLICPDDYRDHGFVLHPEDSRHPQWTLRAEVIWSKPNGLPESVTDRVRRSHEQWFHLTKQGRYYAAVDEIREEQRDPSRSGSDSGSQRRVDAGANGGFGLAGKFEREYDPRGKLPGSVWTIPSEPLKVPERLGVDHFAAFPQELVRRIILGWSPSGICTACGEGRVPVVEKKTLAVRADTNWGTKFDGSKDAHMHNRMGTDEPIGSTEATITGYACACDVTLAPTTPAVILDPFVGTGTVPMVARALGRYGVGIDLSRDYLRLAKWRIGQSRHGAKSINRTNRERQGKLW